MPRRTREQRKREVLDAAAERLGSAQVSWASDLTFGELSTLTGIDQSQIARDFGSKDALTDELIQHLLEPDVSQHHVEHMADWVSEIVAGPRPLGAALVAWAQSNNELTRQDYQLLRTILILWAGAQEGSREWRAVGDHYRRFIDLHAQEATILADRAVAQGAVRRAEITVEEAVVTMNAVVEGFMLRAAVAPDLIPDDLTGKIVRLLLSAVVGPDEQGPIAQIDGLAI